MGADSTMFEKMAQQCPFKITLLNWPEFHGEKSLAELATRLAKIIEHHGQNVWLGGSSLGGMVALEMAQINKVQGVILLGSAMSKHDISSFLLFFAPLIHIIPIKFIQWLLGWIPNRLLKMFTQAEPRFIRQMTKAICKWEGPKKPKTTVIKIHGKLDRIIPCPKDIIYFLPKAGHLFPMTHPKATAFLIEEAINHSKDSISF